MGNETAPNAERGVHAASVCETKAGRAISSPQRIEDMNSCWTQPECYFPFREGAENDGHSVGSRRRGFNPGGSVAVARAEVSAKNGECLVPAIEFSTSGR